MDEAQVYRKTFETARDNGEVALFHKSNERSAACSAAIDKSVADSNYKTNFYDLKTAAQTVIDEYGADRVAWVLAAVVERSFNDGRYSHANREWAKGFDVPQNVQGCHILTHPYVLNGFIDEARKVFDELNRDTPEKLAKDYHVFMQDYDPFGYSDVFELGDKSISGSVVFELDTVKQGIAEDARAITDGGEDFDTIIEVLSDMVTDTEQDSSMADVYERAHTLLGRMVAYADQHHSAERSGPEKAVPEQDGERVAGFIIRDSVLFENDRGFAFAENAGRVQSYVTWQFTEENGKRDYYWGHYYEDKDKALADFAARITAYKEDYALAKEPERDARKPSILAQLQESKNAVSRDNDPSQTTPKRDTGLEV